MSLRGRLKRAARRVVFGPKRQSFAGTEGPRWYYLVAVTEHLRGGWGIRHVRVSVYEPDQQHVDGTIATATSTRTVVPDLDQRGSAADERASHIRMTVRRARRKAAPISEQPWVKDPSVIVHVEEALADDTDRPSNARLN